MPPPMSLADLRGELTPIGSMLWPFLCAAVVAQSVAAVLQFFVLFSFIDALVHGMQACLGIAMLKSKLEPTVVVGWGMLGVVNGLFGALAIADFFVMTDWPLFCPDLSWRHNLGSALRLACPAMAALATPCALALYVEHAFIVDQLG